MNKPSYAAVIVPQPHVVAQGGPSSIAIPCTSYELAEHVARLIADGVPLFVRTNWHSKREQMFPKDILRIGVLRSCLATNGKLIHEVRSVPPFNPRDTERGEVLHISCDERNATFGHPTSTNPS